ncbi:MAG: S9 family peptidase, partial [candidate division Zixibacteria bacterium]|nr:S9 family peptidase [candidate division Zixibacteria bacterium]
MFRKKPASSSRLIMTCTTVLLVFIAAVATAQRSMTLEDIANLRTVGQVAIAPDGQTMAYTLSVPRNPFAEDNGSAWVELYVAGHDGITRPFVTGKVRVSNVAFTPDGGFITYLAER